jgi:acetolactate synthase-1/2/3 large subunit
VPASLPAVRPVAHILLDYLESEGVDHLFGIPGGPIMPLYEALYERGTIRPVLAKHEAGAVFMADGYARVSGRPGVCCTTTGPGATNALTGMAVSLADQVPVLLVTPQVPTHQFGTGAFQESGPEGIDLVGLFRGVTKWSTMLPHPDRTGAVVRAALRAMRTGRPGPVHLNIPLDYFGRPAPAEPVQACGRYRPSDQPVDRAAAREAAHLLRTARRPVVLAGSGVNSARAWGLLRTLAERLQAPVATTFRAKGALPEDHPLSLGVFGYSGHAGARERLLDPDTDVILVLGSGLGEVSSCGFDPRLGRKRLIQVDVDPRAIGRNFPVAVGVTADAAAALLELLAELDGDEAPGARRPAAALPSLRPPPPPPFAGTLKPQAILREIAAALPRDAMVFVDNGTIRAWCGQHLPARAPGSFFVNMGMASMGWATAAVIGGKLASPGRAAVALVGDAAFLMNGTELHTAVESKLPVTWVVLNNGGHGMIYHGERAQFAGKFRSSVFARPIDAAGMAEALGARAVRVREPGQLEAALARPPLDGPLVLDVAADLHEAPPMGARVKALERQLAAA